ncbi:MAG: signal peptidase II, partial [Selenomonadaceae bacterium]|nr:signal peptidase II [Selenomonadaceae bacterium]
MPLGIGILVFIIDQLVKYLVVSTMHLGQSLPVIKGIFHITYVLNPGAAFGMLEHQRWFFIVVALAAVLLGGAFYKKLQQESFLMRSGAGLLLGGAVGNLADRIQSGLVVDFLDFRVWPVYNIADIAICAGAG